jgi:hypothetical protein
MFISSWKCKNLVPIGVCDLPPNDCTSVDVHPKKRDIRVLGRFPIQAHSKSSEYWYPFPYGHIWSSLARASRYTHIHGEEWPR